MSTRILSILITCLVIFVTPNPAHAVIVVSSVAQLEAAVSNANAGGEAIILVADGIYDLSNLLYVTGNNITIQGQSGNRDAVILRGQGMHGGVSHVFLVRGSHFTIRNMTIGWVANHGIQVQGEHGASYITMGNLRVADCFEQLIKVSYNAASANASTHGVLEDSLLEYTAGVGPQYYIGGIDAHQSKNWTVRRNIFRNIASPSDTLAEHAIHFWSGSEDTLVEANLIIDCDRGIGFGMGERGHVRGVIRNNMIYHSNRNSEFADVGIDLQSSSGAMVYNNTIFFEHGYPNAIEYRFAATSGAFIANNLTNKAITSRDGATATMAHNVTTAQASWFVAPSSGDLHLAFAVPTVVDQGTTDIPGLPVPFLDFDGQQRPIGAGVDIGADEYGAPEGNWRSEVGVINSGSAQLQGVLRGFNSTSNQVWTRNVSLAGHGRLELDIAEAAGNAAPDIKSLRLDISSGQAVGYQKFYQSGKYRVGLEASPRANQERLFVPHIASNNEWWTGIDFPYVAHNNESWTGLVVYNPGNQTANLTLTYFDAQGGNLGSNNTEVGPGQRMVGTPDNLKFPDGTEWFMAQASHPVTGFELFGTTDSKQLGGYSVVNLATSSGLLPKLERNGWTGIAFVNPGEATIQTQVQIRNNTGSVLATNTVNLNPGQKWVAQAFELFPGQDISSATYISFTATGDVVGFQLNGSADGTMLDAIPALGGTHTGTQQLYFPQIAAD